MTAANNSPETDTRFSLKVVHPTTNSPSPETISTSVPTQISEPSETQKGGAFLQKWATVGIIIVALGYVGLQPVSQSVSGEATVESTPEKRQAITMSESGTVKKIYVRQNDLVRVGQPIIELQNDELDRQLDELSRQIIQAQSERELAQRQMSVALSNQSQFLIKYQNSRHRAAKLQREIDQNQQPRIRQLESAKLEKKSIIEGLSQQLATVDEQFLRYETLVKQGAVSKDRLTEIQLKRTEIFTQIGQAKYQISAIDAQIADAQKQKSDELIEQRQPEVEDAAAALQLAASEIQKASADVQKWSRQIPQLEAQKQRLHQRQDKLTILATKSGVVITPDLDLLSGQKLQEGKDILMIADSTSPSLVVELTQEDALLVKPGMSVIFRPQDAEWNGYKAKVSELPPAVSFDSAQHKLSVKVRLKFENESAVSHLMLGTKGNAHIEVEQMRIYQKIQREFLKLFPVGKFF